MNRLEKIIKKVNESAATTTEGLIEYLEAALETISDDKKKDLYIVIDKLNIIEKLLKKLGI